MDTGTIEVDFMKKVIAIIAAVLLLALLAGGLYYHLTYLHIDNVRYRWDTARLDLSGQTLPDPMVYTVLTELKELDLRGTGISAETYDALCQALPECEILWLAPFQGEFYPTDTSHFTISAISDADLQALTRFPALASIDATACQDYEGLMKLKGAYPRCELAYRIPLGDRLLPQDTTEISLDGCTAEQLAFALRYLPQVSYVDAAGCWEYQALNDLMSQYPQCTFRYTVNIGGIPWSHTSNTLVLPGQDASQLAQVLPYLPKVETVRLEGALSDVEAVFDLKEAYPQIRFYFAFDVLGVPVTSMDTFLDLSNIPMESVAPVENALRGFYQMERIEMCDCGISNEEMDALCQRNPETRFVWAVDIGRRIHIRTDATYLMPFQYGTKLTDKDVGNLKYCVDMICIDFGHSEVSDISFLAYMPHMKYLLLGDTRVSDISVCAGLQELAFVELFMTDVKDYSPLIQCPALRDLNISYALPDNVDDLCKITQLENLWMKGYWWPDGKAQLRQALPDATIIFSTPGEASATDHGWRKLDNYYAMRDLLGMFYMEY